MQLRTPGLIQLIQSIQSTELIASYKNGNFFCIFNEHAYLFSFYARGLLKAYHVEDLDLMDRKKATHLRKRMKRYF